MVDCELLVVTKQVYDSHTDSLKENYKGTIAKRNNNIYIIYKEDCHLGGQITNQIKVCNDGSVDVRRTGQQTSFINFTKDKTYRSLYDTGYGAVKITFKPIDIICTKEEEEYKIKLKYEVYTGDNRVSQNEYIIEASF